MTVSETGVWIDDDTGEVVYAPPRHGTQIVPKGGDITNGALAYLERLGLSLDAAAAPEPAPVPPEPAPVAEPVVADDKTVTSEDLAPKPAKAAGKTSKAANKHGR